MCLRAIAHPYRAAPGSPAIGRRFRNLMPPPGNTAAGAAGACEAGQASPPGGGEGGGAAAAAPLQSSAALPRLVLAIGPESGWDVSGKLFLRCDTPALWMGGWVDGCLS